MDGILRRLDAILLKDILAGADLPIDQFHGNYDNLAVVMAHCVLNGPVGVRKHTTFHKGVVGCIGDLFDFGEKITNRNWQNLCREFAIKLKVLHPEVCANCQQTQRFQDLWPLNVQVL